LVFQAKVNGRQVHGCDFLHFDDNGLIDDLTVMVRPLAEAMDAQVEQIKREVLGA
jgi:hypothetical protein